MPIGVVIGTFRSATRGIGSRGPLDLARDCVAILRHRPPLRVYGRDRPISGLDMTAFNKELYFYADQYT